MKERLSTLEVTRNTVLNQVDVKSLQDEGFTVNDDSLPLEEKLTSKETRDKSVQYRSWNFKGVDFVTNLVRSAMKVYGIHRLNLMQNSICFTTSILKNKCMMIDPRNKQESE